VVWYDFAYGQTAAMSCCPSIGFFCGDGHLQQWMAAQTAARAGYRLTIDEALEVGRAIFGPVFAAAA
jgi:alkylmercury lyase